MLKKTILLTGSNGLLGQKLVDKLKGRNAIQLIATSIGEDRYPDPDGYTYEPLDIRDEARFAALLDQYAPTEVVNTAALTNVDKCETEQDLCRALNVDAVAMMARLCKERGIRLVHLSTDFIFDGEEGPYKEKDAPNPVSFYGQSKLDGEKAVLESGVANAIVRTMLVYGVVHDMSRSNIVLWARKALMEGTPIKVVNDQFRSPTLAEDLADGVIAVVMKERTGIYHVSGPEMLSVLEMVHAVADHWKLDKELITPISSESLNQAARRPPRTGFIIIKAQTELGYKPRTFAEGLQVVDLQIRESAKG